MFWALAKSADNQILVFDDTDNTLEYVSFEVLMTLKSRGIEVKKDFTYEDFAMRTTRLDAYFTGIVRKDEDALRCASSVVRLFGNELGDSQLVMTRIVYKFHNIIVFAVKSTKLELYYIGYNAKTGIYYIGSAFDIIKSVPKDRELGVATVVSTAGLILFWRKSNGRDVIATFSFNLDSDGKLVLDRES